MRWLNEQASVPVFKAHPSASIIHQPQHDRAHVVILSERNLELGPQPETRVNLPRTSVSFLWLFFFKQYMYIYIYMYTYTQLHTCRYIYI